MVAPALPYGSSGEHAGFAGTLSIGAAALEQVVVELVRSADAFAGVVLVSGHGGNAAPLAAAVAHAAGRGAPGARLVAAHRGRRRPRRAHRDVAAARPATRASSASPAPRPATPGRSTSCCRRCAQGGVAAVSPNGVLGDPPARPPTEGAALLDALAADLAAAVRAWRASGAMTEPGGGRHRRGPRHRRRRRAGAGRREGWRLVLVDRCADDPALDYALATPADLDAVVAACGGADARRRRRRRRARPGRARRRGGRWPSSRFGGLDAAVAAAGCIGGGAPAWETTTTCGRR